MLPEWDTPDPPEIAKPSSTALTARVPEAWFRRPAPTNRDRILVGFDKQKKAIRTGVPASQTATEVGVTIDNPFISTTDDLYRTGTRAARLYAGGVMTLTGTVTAINRRGDTGQASYPTYAEVQDSLNVSPRTYAQVRTLYLTTMSLSTYQDVQDFWFDLVRDDDANQVFGNVQGARVYDRGSKRWYRIRQGTLDAGTISFSADDDLTFEDAQGVYGGGTYAQAQTTLAPLSYRQVFMAGLYSG